MTENTRIEEEEDVEEEAERLSRAGQEAELPGPGQLYLQEIGAVKLLTAAEEVELAKEIENGHLLARYQRELSAGGRQLSYGELACYMLERLRKLIQRIRP